MIMGPKLITSLMFATMLILITQMFPLASAKQIGVCYGRNGNNLPTPKDIISLYERSGIQLIRIYDPNPEVLNALRGSIPKLNVAIGIRNEDLLSLAESSSAAKKWIKTNIAPYIREIMFKWIIVGNEVIPGPNAIYVPKAMNNIYKAVKSVFGVEGIMVTTVLSEKALSTSYPPSLGAFSGDLNAVMTNVASFLNKTGAPLMVNVYPYFFYASNSKNISLDYALFNSSEPMVDEGYHYYNLFDALVDAFNVAVENLNYRNVKVAIAETGWPTKGNEPYTSVKNAQTYNKKLMDHVLRNATPRRPGYIMEMYFFAMFNENLKGTEVERNFGFFYPTMEPVYKFW